ncbi:hypothetical protein DIS24_g4668 [Lasiodiplodia hormozganensis]|uniref:Uncharacterized protein n=1 Tax=Lasiodiplodia hormozganensis TaxID=869390 RepID=A0AA39YTY9_9PEZI|nr:hypothetical protein DIS24_g4668 [Lasiodiplodia hormozganensis]
MKRHEPASPHSPWRPLALRPVHAPPPPYSMEQAMQADAKINKKAAQRRSADAAAAAEHTTACIVEFSSLSGIKPGASFLGWFPPVDKHNRMEEAPYECLQLRLGMDMDVKAARKKADSSDDSDDDEDDDESGIWNDWYEDEDDDHVDLDHPKRPAPLLWLRFPLHTIPPMGVPRDVGDNELVHLLMPAYVFLPEKKPADDNNNKSIAAIAAAGPTAATKPVSRTSSFASSSSSNNSAGSTASKNFYPTPTSAPSSDDADTDADADDGSIAAGSVKLTRYTTAYTRTGWQPPLYIRQAAAESGIDPHALCYIDIDLGSTRPGAVAVVPARVMKLRSAVENVLKGDVRDVGECLHLRVHAVWSRKLADAVEQFGRRVEVRAAKAVREGGVGGGGGGGGGKMQEKREMYRLMRAAALALPGEEHVGVEVWDNFVKWKAVRGGMRRMKCDHKLSSTVEKTGLVEKSGWESSDESEVEEIIMEKKRIKTKKADVGAGVKKQKVSYGGGANSLIKFSGSKALAEEKGRKA